MNDIDRLTELFKEFPGIGPRQARRFVFFLLRKNSSYIQDLVQLLPRLKNTVKTCLSCQRYFPADEQRSYCSLCADAKRSSEQLLIVSRDTDLESIEKSGVYDGYYFVLGGIVPVLEEENAARFIRLDMLHKRIQELISKGLTEIILAMNANPDGDNTATFLKKNLASLCETHTIRLTVLGRGLSTGTELEYSDKETISHALKNRQ